MPPYNKKLQISDNSRNMIWLLTAMLLLSGEYFVKGDSSIPHLCDNVKCPDLSELTCPTDSSVRELLAEPLIALEEHELYTNSSTDISEVIFSQCCLNKKCICNLCHIPDCHKEGEVVVELKPESIDTPGFCCGKYECQLEPNCTEVHDTESYWLTNCQRCKCYSGQRICHQSCDEGIKKPAMCQSKTLNKFYEHGQSWKYGCYDCECINGEDNCMITFCKALPCRKQRQVMLKDSCCPVCWPKGFPMPNAGEDDENDEDDDEDIVDNDNGVESGNHYDDENIAIDTIHDYNDEEIDLELKPVSDLANSTTTLASIPTLASSTSTTSTTTTTTTTSTTTTTTTAKPIIAETTTLAVEIFKTPSSTTPTTTPCKIDNISSTSTTPEPCNRQEVPATYQVYPQVVELMRYSQHNDILYTIIGCLSVLVVVLAAWNIHLKAKQRSYRPVSNFDDNFNRMSSNIKKMNDYV